MSAPHDGDGKVVDLDAVRQAEKNVKTAREKLAALGVKPQESQATILVGLVRGAAELWHSADGEGWATITVDGHQEHHRVGGQAFRRWAQWLFYAEQKTSIGQGLRDAIGVIEGLGVHDGPEHPLALRVAEHEGALYLDLADRGWRAIEISGGSWRVITDPPVRFARPAAMRALPVPVRGGSLDKLWEFVNIRDKRDRRLLTAALIGMVRASGPFVIVMLYGEPGAAKSTTTRICRMLVDPNAADVRSAPRESRDVVITAKHSWVMAIDNVSSIPEWLSDALCRLATGGGYAARSLYTDSDEHVVDVMRPTIITGITEVAERGDLLDRTLGIELEPVRRRVTERELYADFERARPAVLGALLDAVAAAHAGVETVELLELPRMADFAAFATAAETHLGWKAGQVVEDLTANRAHLNELPLDHSVVVPAIKKIVKDNFELFGTATEILVALNATAQELDEGWQRHRGWPKTAADLGRELARLAPNLRATGICTEKLPRTPGMGTRGWTIHTYSEERNDRHTCHVCHGRRISDGSGGSDGQSRGPEGGS